MTAASQFAIEFASVSYTTDGRMLLSGINLQIRRGETLVLLGRSGAGKTTALKLINALLIPTSGEVRVDGRTTTSWNHIDLRRSIGYAIQDVGLLPHLTLARNIALVPRLQQWPTDKIRSRTEELMALVGLPPAEFRDRYPHQLSGGQRQRVGLARALAADPPLLLMDEPFGALDPLTRAEMQREFRTLQQSLHKTVVFVTHDVREALLLGNRIALMDKGTLAGLYSPAEFVRSADPLASAYVAALREGDRQLNEYEKAG